jgi:hypothetical protein
MRRVVAGSGERFLDRHEGTIVRYGNVNSRWH